MNFYQKSSTNFCCECCNYITHKKTNFEKHLATPKHKQAIKSIKMSIKSSKLYTCEYCKKYYADYSGLWRHNKKCPYSNNNEITLNTKDSVYINNILFNESNSSKLLQYLINENKELINENKEFKQMLLDNTKQLVELSKDKNVNNITNNTNNNQHFNLNFFLNETCKDAMNIEDFVSSIKVNIEDLEHTGINGYVEGISNIFIKNLNSLENHLRPLHCSDAKREIIYIKNNNEWIKEKDDKPILTNAIKNIARENIKQISLWKEQNPGCTLSDSKKNNTYLKILSNSMCGINEYESNNNIHKIISNLSKETYINKSKI